MKEKLHKLFSPQILSTQSTKFIATHFIILTAWEGRFCADDVDGCRDESCFVGVDCIDNPAPMVGANCSACPSGYDGDGRKCLGTYLHTIIHCIFNDAVMESLV